MLTAAALSSFVNNTAVVAVLLPVAVKLAGERGLAPGAVLIPLSFASMLGGTNTLIGTSTNLLVNDLAVRRGLPALSLFEFARLGLVFTAAGLVYMVVVGRRLLPARRAPTATERYGLREYLAELAVGKDSDLVGRPMRDVDLEESHGVEVMALLRDERRIDWPSDEPVRAGDLLLVHGLVKDLFEVRQVPGLRLQAEVQLGDEQLTSEDVVLVEVVVAPTSRLRGRTPREMFFRQRYNMTILAIRRREEYRRTRLSRTPLAVGDTLLLRGRRAFLDELTRDPDFLVLGELEPQVSRRQRMWAALAIVAAVPALAATGLVSIVVAALAGMAALVVTRCLTMQEAYEAVDWSVVFLLAGMIPLGIALERSGAARLVAEWTVVAAGALGPAGVLSAFYLLASLLTEVMSNNATAILLTPIAGATAAELGVDPRAFLFAIAFAASASFMTPVGYQTNALIYGPGAYRYADFLRVGAPLNLLLWVLASLLLPVLWPLR